MVQSAAEGKTKPKRASQHQTRPKSASSGLEKGNGSCQQQLILLSKPSTFGSQQSIRPATAPSRAPRDIWPQDMQQKPERFCVGCRGGHQAAHEHNPAWQPYTPLQRFKNLNMLDSRFLAAVRSQELPVALTGGLPAIRWLGVSEQGKSLKPDTMSEQQYKHLLPLFFQGAREGHETYRFLSTAAALDLLAAASSSAGVVTGGRLQHGGKAKAAVPLPHASWLLEVLPEVAVAVKAGLNTLQPSLAAHMLLMLQRLLKTNCRVGSAMVSHYRQLLPAMALMRQSNQQSHGQGSKRLLLPPLGCLPPVGSFTGEGRPPAGCPQHCQICGVAFSSNLSNHLQQHVSTQQEGICGQPALPAAQQRPAFGGEAPAVHYRAVAALTKPRRVTLVDLVDETLQVMVEVGGSPGLAAVKRCMPTFDYCNPKD